MPSFFPEDRRGQLVSPTPAGRRVLGELCVVNRDELRRFRREMLDVLDEIG
jgi:hypothetical protein